VSGHGEQVEIVRSKGSRLVGAGQRPVGLRPRPPCVRLAAALPVLDAMRFNTRPAKFAEARFTGEIDLAR
jgi:hypothetical protein